MADSFINRLVESKTINNSDYTVFDVNDPNKGSFFTKKISLDTLSKKISADISTGLNSQINILQTSINNANSLLANKLDKSGTNLSQNEKMTGPLLVDSNLNVLSSSNFYNFLDLNDNLIKNLKTPISAGDAVNKKYVDSLSGLYIPLSGGSSKQMSGYLYLYGNPQEPNHATNKQYVDFSLNNYLPLSAGDLKKLTGDLFLYRDPTNPDHAVNKQYVDFITTTIATNINAYNNATFLTKNTDSMFSGSTLTLGGNPSSPNHAANKNYVDTTLSGVSAKLTTKTYVDSNFIPLSGGTMIGVSPLILNSEPNLLSNPKQASTKNYVDENATYIKNNYISLSGAVLNQGYITAPYDDPAIPRNLVTKAYTDKTIDSKLNTTTNFVRLSGNDRMTGPLYLNADPNILSDPKIATTKKYVDDAIQYNSYFVHISGYDTITGPLSVNNTFYVGNSSVFTNVISLCNKRIMNVADPLFGKDASNKDYVLSSVVSGINSASNLYVPLTGRSNVTGPLSVTSTFTVTGTSDFRNNVNFNDNKITRFTPLIKTIILKTDYIQDEPTNYANIDDTYVLRPSDNGSVLYVHSGGICYIAIPNNLPIGFNLMVIKSSTYTLTFKPDTTLPGIFISNPYGYRSIPIQFGICSMLLVESGRMIITGDLT